MPTRGSSSSYGDVRDVTRKATGSGAQDPSNPARNEIRFTAQPIRRGSSTAIADLFRQRLDTPPSSYARIGPGRTARKADSGRHYGTGFAVGGAAGVDGHGFEDIEEYGVE